MPASFWTEHRDVFKRFVTPTLELFKNFHEDLINECKSKNVPIYIVRYEDLLTSPKENLKEVFKFILGVSSLEGTFVDHQIEKVLA